MCPIGEIYFCDCNILADIVQKRGLCEMNGIPMQDDCKGETDCAITPPAKILKNLYNHLDGFTFFGYNQVILKDFRKGIPDA